MDVGRVITGTNKGPYADPSVPFLFLHALYLSLDEARTYALIVRLSTTETVQVPAGTTTVQNALPVQVVIQLICSV